MKVSSLLTFIGMLLVAASASAQLSPQQMSAMLKKIDDVMTVPSDYQVAYYMQQTDSDGEEKVWQVMTFRRDQEGSLMVIANKPHTEAGKGYLRAGQNLWFYDPSTGKWERRGEDRSFFARSSRRRDFDVWRLHDEYDPTYVAKEKVGGVDVHRLKLTLKKTVTWESDFPSWEIWVNSDTGLPVKVDQFAESGKLMRSVFYPKWQTKKHPKTGKDLVMPQETRIFDQVDKGTRLHLITREMSFDPLAPNMFSKAWLEAKSR
jgi:outer membrane lipoprotein-sorting protein